MAEELSQCFGVNRTGERCSFMLSPGRLFCEHHTLNKKSRPVRPSRLMQSAHNKVARNAVIANRRTSTRANKKTSIENRAKRNARLTNLIIQYVEGRTGIAHLSISYPGYNPKEGTKDEKQALRAIWYLLDKYTFHFCTDIARIYHQEYRTVLDAKRWTNNCLKPKNRKKFSEYVSIIEDVIFQIRMQKIRAVRTKRG